MRELASTFHLSQPTVLDTPAKGLCNSLQAYCRPCGHFQNPSSMHMNQCTNHTASVFYVFGHFLRFPALFRSRPVALSRCTNRASLMCSPPGSVTLDQVCRLLLPFDRCFAVIPHMPQESSAGVGVGVRTHGQGAGGGKRGGVP